MKTRSWRKAWVAVGLLFLLAQGAIAAPPLQDFEERVLQAIARHADREAATALIEAWQQKAQGVSTGGVALNEGFNGHYLTAKQLMARVISEHPDDSSARLGSLVLVLLEGNPPTCRRALEELALVYPENAQLQQRYSDVLESMGMAPAPLPRPEEPAEAPNVEPTPPPAEPAAVEPAVVATPAPRVAAPTEIRPVQAESVREQLLRQLAEAQARQAREEAARQQRAKEEQARKRREEAARLAAEKRRREEASRLAAEQRRQQEVARQAAAERAKAEQARQAQEKRQQEARRAAEQKAPKAAVRATPAPPSRTPAPVAVTPQEQARQAVEQRKRLDRAEQERWLAARRNQPSAPPVAPQEPVVPTPPVVQEPSYVLKPVKIANRRVWIGEERASVHARLGRPSSVEGPSVERYAGLTIWYDARKRVSAFELASAWYYGPGGVRPGLTLREVLRTLPNSDGLFHLRAEGPEATNSLYVLSTLDGTLAELQFNDEVWLSTMVRTTTPAGATHLYEELLKKGPVRRLAPDYVFALEARRRPLP